MGEKQYCGNAKIIETKHGPLTKLSLTAEDVSTLERNLDKGWVDATVCERREPSKGGMTHYIVIDDWKPQDKDGAPQSGLKDMQKPEWAEKPESQDDLPF